MYLNKVVVVGNLTKNPELKALPSGSKVCQFGLATNRTWKDKNGAKQEEVEFHNLTAFGRQAEVIAEYCVKGSQLLVEGRLKTSNWEDKESGKKMYRTEIVVESMQLGSKPKGRESKSSAPEPTDDMGFAQPPETGDLF